MGTLKNVIYDEPVKKFDSGKVVAAVGEVSGPMTVVSSKALDAVAKVAGAKDAPKDGTVVVGEDRKDLAIVVYGDKKKKVELEKQVLVAKWDKAKASGETAVVSLDDDDKTIRESALRMAKAKGTKVKTSGTFAKQGDRDPIVLLAHGSPIGDDTPLQNAATKFAGKKPDAIVKWLISSGLQPDYGGTVYIDGCFTASGTTGGANFAKSVYDGLVKAGYLYLQVKGNIGSAVTLSTGSEWNYPAELDAERTKVMAFLKTQKQVLTYADLTKFQDTMRAEIKELENSISDLAEDQQEVVRETVEEMEKYYLSVGFENLVGTFGPEMAKK